MKVVVFGGSGFVGSHVVDALVRAEHEVSVFDLAPPEHANEGARFVEGDIRDADAVEAAARGTDVIYNFAGLADLDECLDLPVGTVAINVLGCVNQLEAARHNDVHRFIMASTIYVYSESGGFYRASKQACELYVEEYGRRFDLGYTILRYGSLYGRRADDRNGVHRFLRQALVDRRIEAAGSGDDMREYIHVEDAALASVKVLAEEFRNQHVILSGQQSMRFADLLKMIREIVGEDVEIRLDAVAGRSGFEGHYSLTPYSFRPKVGRKLVCDSYYDLGQGLLDCLHEIYEKQANGALADAD